MTGGCAASSGTFSTLACFQEKLTQIRKTSREQAMAVLSEEQRQQFEKMQGAKIDLPVNLFGGGRRPQQ
jgi:hypothetical protein